jgi:hypothetical protein
MTAAELWKAAGHEVIFLNGIDKFIPADICFVHVDLSIIPEVYIDFANRYPVTVNAGVKDIRKSTFSQNLLNSNDTYTGPVIVKTNLNYSGWPEMLLQKNKANLAYLRWKNRFFSTPEKFYSSYDYKIYQSLDEVPLLYYDSEIFVIEKFLPERKGDIYYNNCYMFMGDQDFCVKFGSKLPIVKSAQIESQSVIDPHPKIIKMRHQMNFEYGKFDYAIHNGEPVLYDLSATYGTSRSHSSREQSTHYFHRKSALESFFS